MINAAFIPVRGGSKSVPLKNTKEIAGHPLLYWTAKAAQDCKEIDRIYIATDCDIIRQAAESFGFSKIKVTGRSPETATDTASTESAMLEFAQEHEFDNIVLIQATSPLLTADDLNGGFHVFYRNNIDSVLSVVVQKRFLWKYKNGMEAEPLNYDIYHRPRRQEFEGYLVENGAFYITGRSSLLSSRSRLSGRIGVYEMPPETYLEIDEPDDWEIVSELLKRREHFKRKSRKDTDKDMNLNYIKMFLTDCDGCLTDGGMYYSESGDELKKFNTRDGYAFQMLREKGIITGIITGEDQKLNLRRAEKMQLNEIISGSKDKLADVQKLCCKYGIELEQVAYVGDDLNDIEVIRMAGFGCAPSDACDEVKEAASYITSQKGGQGVIREAVDVLMKDNRL